VSNKKHIRISNIRDCHKTLAKLINERRRGEIDSSEARDCGYLLKIYIESFSKLEIEEKVSELENLLNEKMGA